MPIYMKFDGIDGDVTEKAHSKWIELQSFSWGVSNPSSAASGGGGGAGKASFQDLHFTTAVSNASPVLMESVCSGKHFPKVEIHMVSQGGDKRAAYLKYELQDVLISSYQTGASSDDRPIDQVSLNFSAALMNIGGASGAAGFCDGSVRPGG